MLPPVLEVATPVMTHPRSFLRLGWSPLVALTLHLRGRWRLRRGDPEGAVRLLEAAAARSPGSFSPLLHLTRAHLRRCDLACARRALARAREVSPLRFEREAAPWMRAEGFDLTTLADVPGSMRPEATETREAEVERKTAVAERHCRPVASHPLGDCKDLDEYTRFRSMPPIQRAEIDDIPWDDLGDEP